MMAKAIKLGNPEHYTSLSETLKIYNSFGVRTFIYTRHKPITDKFFNTKYEQISSNHSGVCVAHIHTYTQTQTD
jgi:hypothetical protein